MTLPPRVTTGGSEPPAPPVSPPTVPPGRAWRAALAAIGRLPQGALSRAFGRLADLTIPRRLRRPVLGAFARSVGIDVSEAGLPLSEYASLDAFFVRGLRPGVRQWPEEPRVAASPVDGVVGRFGRASAGRALQAKGRDYSIAELLGGEEADAERYEEGAYLTLYLSPRHYHRIHAPVTGLIERARYIPGRLLPVNAPAVAGIADLFARNERLICEIDGGLGRVAVVAVGAFNVGRISAAFDPGWNQEPGGAVTNRPRAGVEERGYTTPLAVGRGDEIMAFHLGSTVVLLFERGRAELAAGLREGTEIRLGAPIALPLPGPPPG